MQYPAQRRRSALKRVTVGILGLFMWITWSHCSPPVQPPKEQSRQEVIAETSKDAGVQDASIHDTQASKETKTDASGQDTQKPIALTYHEHVRPIIEQRCGECHTQGGVGPFALGSYKEVYATRQAIKNSIVSRRMPPWPADNQCREYKHSMALTDAQIKTIKEWVEKGAPEGDPKAYKPPPKEEKTLLDRVDLKLKMEEPYTPLKTPDDYRCFRMNWPLKEKAYVTGFQIKPGNKAIVHHLIAYIAPPKTKAHFEQKDKAEKGPGYTCFGGPGDPKGSNSSWLAAWAPGKLGGLYPKGTGVLVEPGSVIIIQMHYNTLQSNPAPDQTTLELKIEKTVEKRGYIVPIASTKWKIPAGEKKYEHKNVIKNPLPVAIKIHSTSLHLHLLGKSSRFFVQREDGKEECLLNIPRWDFNWQFFYDFKKPFVLNPNDKIGLECVWDNSKENQPIIDGKRMKPRDVTWGDGSTDEMCLGIAYVTPL